MTADIKSDMDMMTPLSAIPQHNWNQASSMHSHQQHHNMYSQNLNQNNGMEGQMRSSLEHGMNGNMSNLNGIGHHQQHMSQNQTFDLNPMSNNMGQSMMANTLLHRQPPQRSNSFLHQQSHQQTTQIPRTVGDFHALQRANSDGASINSIGMSPMGGEMEYGGLR